ncbi:rRNA maturation RNase YbeY [Maribacter sp. 2307UL18-2]|uniref:rRNA maturation RNase YbeY n=1 Tax=Maribacter sp. 2307UL18-2 TaxID=3386274 RepID=UPI0039BCE8F8
MIEYHYTAGFRLDDESLYSDWLNRVIVSENFKPGSISYIFCDDAYLLDLNMRHLNHDTLTDIITFDYSENGCIAGDIFISFERVMDNAKEYKVSGDEELHRVMAHGLLHMMDYNDKTKEDSEVMRQKEFEKMKMFHVEQ